MAKERKPFDKSKPNSEQKAKLREKRSKMKGARKATKAVTIDIDEKVLETIDTLAEDDIRTRSNYITFALKKYIAMRVRKVPDILEA